MQKLITIITLVVLILLNTSPTTTLANNSTTIINEDIITFGTTIKKDDLSLCDCNTTFYEHNQLFNNLAANDIKNKTLTCNCGGSLLSNILFVGNWIYISYQNCFHEKNGVDYIYKRQIISSSKCNNCSFYQEFTTYKYETRCNGL